MNKRFSTLMTAGLLMVGALFSNANATLTGVAPADGKYYYISQAPAASGAYALGMSGADKTDYAFATKAITDEAALLGAGTGYMWKASIQVEGGKNVYTFTNKATGQKLAITLAGALIQDQTSDNLEAGATKFSWDRSTAATATAISVYGATMGTQANNQLTVAASVTFTSSGTDLLAYEVAPQAITAAELNENLNGSFGLTLKKKDDLKDVLTVQSNPFTTKTITAVQKTGAVGADDPIYFRVSGDWAGAVDADGIKAFRSSEFIVMDTIPYSTLNATKAGYPFIVVKGADLVDNAGKAFTDNAGLVNGQAAEKDIKRMIQNACFTAAQDVNKGFYIFTTGAFEPKDKQGLKGHAALAAGSETVTVHTYNSKNSVGTGDGTATYFDLGTSNVTDLTKLAGKAVNISFVTTGGNPNKGKAYWADGIAAAGIIDFSKPEGQFIISRELVGANSDVEVLTFKNRESKEEISYGGLYNTADATVFVGKEWNGAAFEATNDTLKLTTVTRETIYDGYRNYKNDDLKDKGFNISVFTELFENVYTVAPVKKDGIVTLSEDVADASIWSLDKKVKAAKTDVASDDKDYYANTDSIIVVNTYNVWNAKDKEYEKKADSTVMFAYSIKLVDTNNYLVYTNEDDKNAYTLSANVYTPIVLKEKNGKIHLLPAAIAANGPSKITEAKLYGAFSKNKLTVNDDMYAVTDNDLFSIDENTTLRYRNVAGMDTVKVYRNDNKNVVMYEKNEKTSVKDSINFLGIEHIADVPTMKAAMFMDTAFVRNSTKKPLYMFAVGVERITGEWCGVVGHEHEADTVKGRYLVNLQDSLDVYASYAKNPYSYKYDNTNLPRLGFVDAAHTNDKLIIAPAKGVKPVSADTIALGDNDNKYCTFALLYVDREAESFKMETKGGFVKYINGAAVVTPNATDADVFNFNKTDDAPTANDNIDAATVSVVASNGAVIINNAAGKKVAISNILGQTIANTVITSDNATIAAPAGVVVVAVEGEAAVKAIIK